MSEIIRTADILNTTRVRYSIPSDRVASILRHSIEQGWGKVFNKTTTVDIHPDGSATITTIYEPEAPK